MQHPDLDCEAIDESLHVLKVNHKIIVTSTDTVIMLALVKGGTHYPEGSLFSDCEAGLPQFEALSLDRPAWRAKMSSLT